MVKEKNLLALYVHHIRRFKHTKQTLNSVSLLLATTSLI